MILAGYAVNGAWLLAFTAVLPRMLVLPGFQPAVQCAAGGAFQQFAGGLVGRVLRNELAAEGLGEQRRSELPDALA